MNLLNNGVGICCISGFCDDMQKVAEANHR